MSLLDQIENQLSPRFVGVEEFAESSEYCNPPEAPIWMADLSFRPIGDIVAGDEVMGWAREGLALDGKRLLRGVRVEAIKRRHAPVVKVTMESGRSFRCTADHRWLTCSNGGKKNGEYNQDGEWYCPPKPGQTIVRVIDPTPELQPEDIREAAWLGGIFDGEGSVGKNAALTIAQSDSHNPTVCTRIERALDHFGFKWSRSDRAYLIRAGEESTKTPGIHGISRQMITNFANWCQPAKRLGLMRKVMSTGWRIPDRIASVEPDGEHEEVVALTTATGNYVCNGYASKNCNMPLYPAQTVLLKTIFCEELTGPEEDILDFWIAGGRNGNEIVMSPNIRERTEWLRAANYPHFREVILVGGRRSSKGFCTGIAMAKTMWDCLQLQDPGAHYGIDPEKEIYFSCVAGSEEQAKEFQYADFSSTIQRCKAFDPYLIKSLETEIRIATNTDLRKITQEKARGNRIQKDIARLRGKALAANAGTLRGSATMTIAQPMDAKVLTPTGWTTIGELDVGTVIVGSDGQGQTIEKLHPRGVQKAFRVEFSDGSATVCGEDHLWTLHQKDRGPKTKSLKEFAQDITKANGMQVPHGKWRLPSTPVVEGDYELPYHLSPYLLGVMLGDGSTTWRSAKFYNEDPSIVEAISEVLPTDHSIVSRAGIGYDLVNTNAKENLVIRGFKEIGAWGHRGPEKFIPEFCFQMSSDDRRSLLQGLLDTDGSVNGTSVRFGSSSKDLAEGVIALVRSLGGYATLYVADRLGHKIRGRMLPAQKDFCEVCISGLDGPLFRSKLKLAKCADYARYESRHRRLVDVVEIDPCEMQCITVSNDDGLYITDDYIVTHNCIDEMAHMIPGESKAAADKVYEAAEPSLDQFGEDALIFCNSSPYTKLGMFFERYEAGLVEFDPTRPIDDLSVVDLEGDLNVAELNGNPRLFMIQFPSWAMFEGYQKSKNKHKFKSVLTASPEWDPEELDEDGDPYWSDKDKLLINAARAAETENPETYKVERRGKFAEVSDAYMLPGKIDQMFAGIPVEVVFTKDEDGNDQPKTVLSPLSTNLGQGRGQNMMYRYKFHLDPSSSTAGFGFAIAHTEIIADWRGVEEEHVVFDLIKRWMPDTFPGKVIKWDYILPEITQYAEMFAPFEITFGQHESQQAIQMLSEKLMERNFSTRVYQSKETAELNWKRWEVCKSSIYAALVHAPNDSEDTKWAALELKFLQKQSGTQKFPRIDRQEIGPVQTKDMADCIAECINTLIGNQMANRTRDRLSQMSLLGGAAGGYAIGLGSNPALGGTGPPGISGFYSRKDEKEGQAYENPARGVVGRGRGRRMGNRSRGY